MINTIYSLTPQRIFRNRVFLRAELTHLLEIKDFMDQGSSASRLGTTTWKTTLVCFMPDHEEKGSDGLKHVQDT